MGQISQRRKELSFFMKHYIIVQGWPLRCTLKNKHTHIHSLSLSRMNPSESSSNLYHHQIDQEKDAKPAISNVTLNVGIAGDDNSTEVDAKRNREVVVNIPEDKLENTDGRVVVNNPEEVLENTDRTVNTAVSGGNRTPAMPVLPCHNDHNFRLRELRKTALAFFTQLAPVFVGFVISMSSSCSCSCLCSSSHSHSSCSCSCSPSQTSDNSWVKVTVVVAILVGFVANLISIFWTNIRYTFSSVTAKFGFGAVITAVLISVGATLPIDPKGKIPVTVIAVIPVLLVIARA